MKKQAVKAPVEDLDEMPYEWADESLDDDALELSEWAFLQGYYGEV